MNIIIENKNELIKLENFHDVVPDISKNKLKPFQEQLYK